MQPAAPKLEIALAIHACKTTDDIAAALRAAEQEAAQAIVTMEDPMIQSRRAAIAEFSILRKIPVMGEFRAMADAGALMAYGPTRSTYGAERPSTSTRYSKARSRPICRWSSPPSSS